MIGVKRGDPKRGEAGKARGKPLLKSQAIVGKPFIVQPVLDLATTCGLFKTIRRVGERKGLPCTITPEEVEGER